VSGKVSFQGHEPVQFDRLPLVRNDDSGQFEPFVFHPEFARIPREARANTQAWPGKVVSGSGNSWKVKLYPDGPKDASTAFTVGVSILGIPDSSTDLCPAGLWLDRVQSFPDPNGGDAQYFWILPLGSKVAQTPAGGIPAMSGATPGSATCTIFDFNGTTIASGRSVKVFNMASGAIGASKYIVITLIDGCWFIIVEAC